MTQMISLVGSPRPVSTSEKLATYFADGLTARGWQRGVEKLGPAVRSPERWAALESNIRAAEVVVLAFPLYVDALPAETTLALERLAAAYQAQPLDHPQRWLFILNCGFFEAAHNDIATTICRQFTRETGVTYSGAFTLGGGGMLGQAPLQAKGMLGNIVAGFEQSIEALHVGTAIPDTAFALARKPVCPKWLYFAMANLGMYLGAKPYGNMWKLNAQPYAK